MQPEAIPAGALTHINLAFINFDENYELVDTGGDIVARVSKLKLTYPGLRVMVAVGGWEFNDPPTQTYFSDMASSYDNRQTFISSVMKYLTKYGLDGIDIDWEYPTATDRGGSPDDTDNYVILLAEMQEAFAAKNPGWDISCTLPSSYWYLQNFDLSNMQKYLSWFNFMTYDLHGTWDKGNEWTGDYLRGHTNLTEIDEGFGLLWRNDVDPANVVMGMGFYGRSFTMSDATCHTADCTFSAAGVAGECSNTAGILYYAEIASSNQSLNVATYYDPVTTVKYNVYNGNQWVSYDDAQSWGDKMDYLTSRCLGGIMIWAIDQDTGQYDALAALLGEDALATALLEGGNLSDSQKETLADQFAAYTGQDCYVTEVCTDGTSGEKSSDQVCGAGYTSVTTAHSPVQAAGKDIKGACSKGWYRHICCPTKYMPSNCKWNGEPVRSEIGCSGFCGSDQFQLNTDTYVDATGSEGPCYQGERSLCCDSTEILSQCSWTSCQKIDIDEGPTCPTGSKQMTMRYDDGSEYCQKSIGDGEDSYLYYAQAFCCPTDDGQIVTYDPEAECNPSSCPSTQVQFATALDPPNQYVGTEGSLGSGRCDEYPPKAGSTDEWSYCCNPPESYNEKWPVDPTYLWDDVSDDDNDDIQWAYSDDYGNNAHQTSPGDDYGDNPYGFVMLDGPEGSIDSSFDSTYTVTRREEHLERLVRRSPITTNKTLIDTTFEHSEEVLYIYCNFPDSSAKCKRLFNKGAEDTIIKLPSHVGEGPFARVVSIDAAHESFELPHHHLVKRTSQQLSSKVYRVVIDYNFQAIKPRDDGPINMRVDYTNLLEYWDDVTDTPAKVRRDLQDGNHLSYRDWRGKVGTAKESHERMRKRQAEIMTGATSFDIGDNQHGGDLHHSSKRWFGSFVNWLKKLTTVESSNVGYLSQYLEKSVLLYRAYVGCSRTNAQMSIYLDTQVAMESTYAYYFSGTFIPPSIDGTYAYFGTQPSVYLGLTIQGGARLEYQSPRAALIPTISYPGLAIKGIAAVGPTLDLYGQIVGVIQVSGTVQAGARYTFEKAEVYFPQDDDGSTASKIQGLLDDPEPVETGIVPEFKAEVTASIDVDINITPEAHIGIHVGGSSLLGDTTLVDAQLAAYVNSTLRFHADATGTASTTDATVAYNYGVYLLYNIGFGGWASIPLYTWEITARNLFASPKVVTLYSNGDVLSTTYKRDVPLLASRAALDESEAGVLNTRNGAGNGLVDLPDEGSSPAPKKLLAQARIIGMDGEMLWSSDTEMVNITLADVQSSGGMYKRDDSEAEKPTILATECAAGDDEDDTESSVAKRATSTCGWVLPDFRYNCQVFSDNQLTNSANGQSTLIPGICTNVQKFFTSRALSTNGLALTWEPTENTDRRDFACGSSACAVQQTIYLRDVGMQTGTISGFPLVSCDEFPIASTEEGGSYFGRLPNNPTAIATTCVPDWQQNLQGNCHKLLGRISTNVAYPDDPTAAANWQRWGSGSGTTRNDDWISVTTGGFQRYATYLATIPQAPNMGATQYGTARTGGYWIKRNFTLGLAQPTTATDGAAWGAQPASSWQIDGSTSNTDVTQIACAVNLFGQSDIYTTDYNAYCYNGGSNTNPYFGNTPSFSLCNVVFSGPLPANNNKRNVNATELGQEDEETIGMFGGWGIKNEQPEVMIETPGFVPDPNELLVAEIKKMI
ncbi:hypothetical protein G7054_g4665 [Neopestalotiopsis clavispora]|nr:hypothetical protein G7054_g4665 [Neopestalotiopsis clavispora]